MNINQVELTEEDIDFIKDCFEYYLNNEKQFVSYYVHLETSNRVEDILNKLSSIRKDD